MGISLGTLGLSIIVLAVGFLLGLKRGLKRSILRTVLLLLCIVGAYFLKNAVINAINTVDIDGKTLNDTIKELFTDNELLGKVSEQLVLIVESLLSIIVFVMLVLILQFLSWIIIYPICKIFVKKPTGNKRRIAGGVLGVVISAVMCIAVLAPLVCLAGNVSEFISTVADASSILEDKDTTASVEADVYSKNIEGYKIVHAEETTTESSSEDNSFNELKEAFSDIGLDDFNNNFMVKTYKFAGGWLYDLISTVETKDGKKTNFSTQIGALNGAVKLAQQVVKIADMDFNEMFTSGDSTKLIENMAKLDEIKENMTDEQKAELTDMVKNTVGSLIDELGVENLKIDFTDFDVNEVNFENEAKLFEDFSKLNNEESKDSVDVGDLAKDLADSTIILSVIDNEESDFDIKLTADQQVDVNESLEDYPQEKQEQVKKLLGMA